MIISDACQQVNIWYLNLISDKITLCLTKLDTKFTGYKFNVTLIHKYYVKIGLSCQVDMAVYVCSKSCIVLLASIYV